MKSFNGLLWDTKTRELKEVFIEKFEDIKDNLKCRTITGWPANEQLYAYVDDEGLLIENNPITAHWLDSKMNLIQPIKGNILFVNPNVDRKGNTLSLTKEQKQLIQQIPKQMYYDPENDDLYPILQVIYS